MSDSPISLHTAGPPSTVLPDPDPVAAAALENATSLPESEQRDAIAKVVMQWPRYCDAWARLGERGRDVIESYSAYRVGYHRGLDQLRQNGWRGSGFVRWESPSNRGFLRCLAGLADKASEIGETDEAERCELFLRQLDPTWPPPSLA